MSKLEKIAAEVNEKLRISAMLNTRINSVDNGLYSCGVALDERTQNHFGTVHAAVQWCCMELLGGLIWLAHFNDKPHFFVIRSSKVDFLLPARSEITVETEFPDDKIEALKKSLAETGEASFVVHSVVKRADGKITAKGECDYLFREWREPVTGNKA